MHTICFLFLNLFLILNLKFFIEPSANIITEIIGLPFLLLFHLFIQSWIPIYIYKRDRSIKSIQSYAKDQNNNGKVLITFTRNKKDNYPLIFFCVCINCLSDLTLTYINDVPVISPNH